MGSVQTQWVKQVELHISNLKVELKPSIFAAASLSVKVVANSLFVPKAAMVSTAKRTYLIRVGVGRTE